MSNFEAVLAVIANNSKDIEEVVSRFGGVANFARAAPALFRIWMTIAENVKHNGDADKEVHRVQRMLYYNETTKKKIKAFQQAHGIEADGIVGNQTWDKVEELLK